jgi:hypothetical protein
MGLGSTGTGQDVGNTVLNPRVPQNDDNLHGVFGYMDM